MDRAEHLRITQSDRTKEKKKSGILKTLVIILSVILLIGITFVIYLWNKPHKKIENAKSVAISALDLSKEYAVNEKNADAKYLNKAIEVSGVVGEIEKNQDGGTMVILETGDPTAGVQCTMREKGINVAKGRNIVIKGFCSGNGITGVSLTDCVLK